MSVLGIGVDIVETQRIEHSLERFGERFLHRVFTAGEIAYCRSMKFPARHFAARFAAKEAVSKAFGTGIGKAMGWRDIDVHGHALAIDERTSRPERKRRGPSAVCAPGAPPATSARNGEEVLPHHRDRLH